MTKEQVLSIKGKAALDSVGFQVRGIRDYRSYPDGFAVWDIDVTAKSGIKIHLLRSSDMMLYDYFKFRLAQFGATQEIFDMLDEVIELRMEQGGREG